jgi:aspartate-semialdehyde dehydrogenase
MVKVAVAGATGAVGREILKVLEDRRFPVTELRALASKRSVGSALQFAGSDIRVGLLDENAFRDINIAFFSAGGEISKRLVPKAAEAGATVIDNSSAFRMDSGVPLVVPEVNPDDARKHSGVIANPNCSTIQMVVAVAPLHRAARVLRILIATYQAVSGTGMKAIDELKRQVTDLENGRQPSAEVYPRQIAFNLLPHIDTFQENGYTREEIKMLNETRKILHDDSIRVSATCVRVPVFRAHSEAIFIETERKLTVREAREILAGAPGVKVLDDPAHLQYPTPLDATGSYLTFVGRIREDTAFDNGLAMWVVADQLLKGAALNAVQIAELLLT